MTSEPRLNLPFSQSCENNKQVILAQLRDLFSGSKNVLELASGTGQHATWFCEHMPWLHWQPTELASNLATLKPRCEAYAGANLAGPLSLDVCERPWPVPVSDAIFTANSLHIMPMSAVEGLFRALGPLATAGTVLAVYGPFNYGGDYSSDSNARFDQWLLQQHPLSAIRDFEWVDELARIAGFELLRDTAMPANNRLLAWRRL
ncbi:MAG: DUF938 domain-containing protein [Halioglobus sp.]